MQVHWQADNLTVSSISLSYLVSLLNNEPISQAGLYSIVSWFIKFIAAAPRSRQNWALRLLLLLILSLSPTIRAALLRGLGFKPHVIKAGRTCILISTRGARLKQMGLRSHNTAHSANVAIAKKINWYSGIAVKSP
jgi:hypothetical protein